MTRQTRIFIVKELTNEAFTRFAIRQGRICRKLGLKVTYNTPEMRPYAKA